MQPSFDLNLLKTNKADNARNLYVKAEAAHMLKEGAKTAEKARTAPLSGFWRAIFVLAFRENRSFVK